MAGTVNSYRLRESADGAGGRAGSRFELQDKPGRHEYFSGVRCGRRVAKLCCPPSGKYYGCRHCYNLSYESRNESRLGRPGGLGYWLKVERQYEDLYEQTKRWTYRGQPTKKARKLHALEAQLGQACDRSRFSQLLFG